MALDDFNESLESKKGASLYGRGHEVDLGSLVGEPLGEGEFKKAFSHPNDPDKVILLLKDGIPVMEYREFACLTMMHKALFPKNIPDLHGFVYGTNQKIAAYVRARLIDSRPEKQRNIEISNTLKWIYTHVRRDIEATRQVLLNLSDYLPDPLHPFIPAIQMGYLGELFELPIHLDKRWQGKQFMEHEGRIYYVDDPMTLDGNSLGLFYIDEINFGWNIVDFDALFDFMETSERCFLFAHAWVEFVCIGLEKMKYRIAHNIDDQFGSYVSDPETRAIELIGQCERAVTNRFTAFSRDSI